MAEIALREVRDEDLDGIFEQMRDPEGVWMAAFTAKDPDDRAHFDAHMARVLAAPGVTMRAITRDGQLVGHVAAFDQDGDLEVTYGVDRAAWGPGVASRALALLLREVQGVAGARARGQRQPRFAAGTGEGRVPGSSAPTGTSPRPGRPRSRRPSSGWG